MTTIAQYLPRWVRVRLQKLAPQKVKTLSKKDWQVLPTLPKQKRPRVAWQDDESPPGYRVLWRL